MERKTLFDIITERGILLDEIIEVYDDGSLRASQVYSKTDKLLKEFRK